jgi:hypothetical protein
VIAVLLVVVGPAGPTTTNSTAIYLFIYSFVYLTACSRGTSRRSQWQALVTTDQPVLPFDIIINSFFFFFFFLNLFFTIII